MKSAKFILHKGKYEYCEVEILRRISVLSQNMQNMLHMHMHIYIYIYAIRNLITHSYLSKHFHNC